MSTHKHTRYRCVCVFDGFLKYDAGFVLGVDWLITKDHNNKLAKK